MSSCSSTKGTRKTYSFEEREILITLINKYDDVEDKKLDPASMCKRKSAWAQLAEDYNLRVGPNSVRSAVQLRRCWENMKACRKNREEKRTWANSKNSSHQSNDSLSRNHSNSHWENCVPIQNSVETPTRSVGLPPNVVFEPKASEPFTLQSVCSSSKVPKLTLKREYEGREIGLGSFSKITILSDLSGGKVQTTPPIGPMGDGPEKYATDQDFTSDEEVAEARKPPNMRSNGTQTISPLVLQGRTRRTNRASQKEEELHDLALSEAQLKVDIASMQKEEARVKLGEAHFRKEEARLRMLFFTYKLDRMKED